MTGSQMQVYSARVNNFEPSLVVAKSGKTVHALGSGMINTNGSSEFLLIDEEDGLEFSANGTFVDEDEMTFVLPEEIKRTAMYTVKLLMGEAQVPIQALRQLKVLPAAEVEQDEQSHVQR